MVTSLYGPAYGASPAPASEEAAHSAVLVELKISERMDKPNIKVDEGMRVAEVLPLVAAYMLDTYSIGGTHLIFLALEFMFARERNFFDSVKRCVHLVKLGKRHGAAAFALCHACQKVAVVLRHVVPEQSRIGMVLAAVRREALGNTAITILDIIKVIEAEKTNGAELARADVLCERQMTGTDLHSHHTAFMAVRGALAVIGREPIYEIELIFISTLPPEWRDIAFGPTHQTGAAHMTTHHVITAHRPCSLELVPDSASGYHCWPPVRCTQSRRSRLTAHCLAHARPAHVGGRDARRA
jgi:hypothetical protein